MQLTKGAIGNLINRYKAVLKKCHLMNTFGSLAVAGMLVMGGAGVAGAANTPSEVTIPLSGGKTVNAYNGQPATLSDGSNGKHIFVGGTINNIKSLDPHTHFGTFTDPTSITVTEGAYNWDIYAGSLAVADGSTEGFKETSATSGSTKLVINGGTFEGAELAGGGSASASGSGIATAEVSGSTDVTINSYVHEGTGIDYIMAGNKILTSGKGQATGTITGDTNLTISPADGKTVTTTAVVLGGSGVRVSGGTAAKASDTINGNTNVTINGGTLAGVVGGSIAEVLSGTGTATATVKGNSTVTIIDGTIDNIKFGSNIEADPSVVGGSMAYGAGASAANKGNTLVAINDGTINDKVLGGSLALKGGKVTVGTEGQNNTSGIVVENVSKVGDLVGGNMAEGGTATLNGSSFVEVKAGKVEGDVMGGSYVRGSGTVTTTGNTGVVFSADNNATVKQAEYLVGGDKVLASSENATSTGTISGTSSVTVNGNASVTTGAVVGGSFSRVLAGTDNRAASATVANSVVTINGGKSIAGVVGGGLAEHLSGNGSATSTVTGTSAVYVNGGNLTNIVYTTEAGQKASSSAAVAGAGFATGQNATASVGNSVVVIDGADTVIKGNENTLEDVTYDNQDSAKVVAGGVAINGGTVSVANTSLTMKDGKVTGDLVGGNLLEKDGEKQNSIASTTVNVEGGKVNGEIYGGSYVRNTAATSEVDNTTVNINGGTIGAKVPQGWAQYVVGGGKAMSNATETTSNVLKTATVNISGGDIMRGAVVGGGFARAQGGRGFATANVKDSVVNLTGGTLVGIVGGGLAENLSTAGSSATATAGVTNATLTIGGNATVNGIIYKGNDGVEAEPSSAAVIGGGLAYSQKGSEATASVDTANTTINGGTINGNVFAGGMADGTGAKAEVTNANLTIKGGEINGSVYAGGAALNGGTADVGDFDVRITGGTIKENVVAGNYTGDTGASTFTLLGASPYSGGSSKGSIIIGGDATIGGVVINTNDTTVTVDGMDTTVSKGYESKGNNNTLAFSNYIGDFSSVATGFDTLSAAGGSHVKMDYLSTGPKADDQTGFFAGDGNFNVTGEGTVTVKNVTATDGKTITVIDGGTLEADTLTTEGDTGNGSAKTAGLGSTLIIGNSDLTSIADSSLSSTVGSEIKFTGLADGTALNDITDKLATSNGIVNVGDTKVTELNELVKADGTVVYSDWAAANAAGITNNELKHATMTGVKGTNAAQEAPDKLNGVAVSGIKLDSDNVYIGIHQSSNVTLTGLGGGENFVSQQDGSTGGILLWNGDNTITLGDNAYTGSKKITYIGFGGGEHTVNALGQDRNASRIIVTMGINGNHMNASVVNASHVTLQVEKTIGDFDNLSADHHLSVNADAANVLAGDHILVGSLSLKNGSLVQAGKDIVISGAADSNLSGQGMVDAGQTLTLKSAYNGVEDDDLLLTGKKLDAKAAINSTKGTLAIVTDELITGGDTTLVDDTLVADNVELGGALNASGESLVVVQNFGSFAPDGGFTPGALDNAVSVTGQSLMVYGAGAEQAQQAVAETGHNGAAYYAGKELKLVDGGSLTVGNATATTTVAFGSDSLLVVDGTAMNGKTVFTGEEASPNLTASVNDSSKLHVDNAVAGGFTVFDDGFTSSDTGWAADNVTTDSAMLDASYDHTNSNVTVKTNNAHTVFPNLSDGMADAVNDLYNGKLNNVDSTDMGVRFLSRATNDHYLGTDKDAAAATIESAARIAFAGAVPQMTKMASDAGSNAVVNRLGFANPADGAQAMNAEGKIVDRNTTGFALWIAPLWQSQHGWGMEADNLDYGFNGNLGGVSLGADYTFENAIRAGITFNIGGGYAESSGGDLNSTENRMSFWGLGAYAGWNYENFGLMADVSYTSTWNDLKQDMDSRMGMGDLEADVQASAISAGLRAEYKLETSVLDVIPHIGVRYMSLNTWGFDAESNGGTVLEGDGFHQDIWTFPVGVTFTKDFTLDSGWSFKPSIDFSVIPAAGDIKAKQDVAFTGLPGSYEVETQMMDYLTWQGGVGLEMGNDTMSFGVNYTLQAGQHTTGHGVFGSFRYEF